MMHAWHQRRRLSDGGFALVELLVVISIIALLIAMLLPVLSAARSRARQIQCLAQQKQYHLGLSAYATDNKGWYGQAHYSREWFFVTDDIRFWDSYMGNLSRLVTCPGAKVQHLASAAYEPGHVNSTFVVGSYVFPGARGDYVDPTFPNYFFGWQSAGWSSTEQKPQANVPNERFLNKIYDGGTKSLYISSASVQPVVADGYSPTGIWGAATSSLSYNSHPSSTNIVFVDGHGEMRSFEILIQRYRQTYW